MFAMGPPLASAQSTDVPHPQDALPKDPCLGRAVETFQIQGCEDAACGDPVILGELRSLAGITLGLTVTERIRDRAIERLEATGFFESVGMICEATGESTVVVLDGSPATFITKVSVEGNVYFREQELRKRIFLRPGIALNVRPGKEIKSELVRRQMDSLKRLYRREGLDEVTVRVKAVPVGPFQIEVRIILHEGDRARVRRVVFRHLQSTRRADGMPQCPRVSRRKLEQLAGVGVGDVVTSKHIREITKRTRSFFQSIGYLRPDVKVSTYGDPLAFQLQVLTKHCWLVRIWEREDGGKGAYRDLPSFRRPDPLVEGLGTYAEGRDWTRADFEIWRSLLPFGESGVFDREEAERGVASIRKVLQDNGYLFAEVAMEHRDLRRQSASSPAIRAGPVQGVIDYRLTRNHLRRIEAVRLIGHETFSSPTLLGEMETRTYDFFGSDGHLIVDRVLFDLAQIARYYRDRGFYDFQYTLMGDVSDGAPSRALVRNDELVIWEYRYRERGFRVIKHRSTMGVTLEIPFVEGPRTRIGSIEILGNNRVSNRQLEALLALRTGQPYGTSRLETGLERMGRWYEMLGHHHVEIESSCTTQDPVLETAACDVTDVRAGRVDLVIWVNEGPQTVVGEILWRGNFKTLPEILTRDLPEPGTPFSELRLSEATSKMRNLGIFSGVTIERIGLDERPARGRVGLVVVVEEAQSRFIDLAAGFRTIDREADSSTKAPAWVGSLVGQSTAASDRMTTGLGRALPLSLPDVLVKAEAEYLDLNFRSRGHRFRVPIRYGFSTSDSLRLLSFTPTLTIPRLMGSDVLVDTRLIAELDKVNEQLDRTEYGAASTVTWPLTPRMSTSLGLEAGLIRFLDPEATEDVLAAEDATDDDFTPQVKPTVRWRLDTQNNPINPTRGVALAMEVGYILEIDRDTIAERRETRLNDFIKWEVSAEFAWSMGAGPILAAFARYGGSVGDDDTLLPPNERFTLGGSNGMRGFADHAVGRYDAEGALLDDLTDVSQLGGGNVVANGSVELRIPLMRQRGVWLAAFFDAGALARTHGAMTPGSVRMSSGLGLRYLIGRQIPIRLDWGWVLGPSRCTAWSPGAPGEICGVREELSALHFDLLYPF
jgi:outer membrane protein assembly factor BamA